MAYKMIDALARNLRIRNGVEFSTPALASGTVTTSFPIHLDERTVLGVDGASVIDAVTMVPVATVTAGATQPTFSLVRVNATTGADVAVVATLALTSGGPFTALITQSLTITAANATVLPGELLVLRVAQPASGVAVAQGHLFQISIRRPQ